MQKKIQRNQRCDPRFQQLTQRQIIEIRNLRSWKLVVRNKLGNSGFHPYWRVVPQLEFRCMEWWLELCWMARRLWTDVLYFCKLIFTWKFRMGGDEPGHRSWSQHIPVELWSIRSRRCSWCTQSVVRCCQDCVQRTTNMTSIWDHHRVVMVTWFRLTVKLVREWEFILGKLLNEYGMNELIPVYWRSQFPPVPESEVWRKSQCEHGSTIFWEWKSTVGKRAWQSSALVSPMTTLNRDAVPIGDNIRSMSMMGNFVQTLKQETKKKKNLWKKEFPKLKWTRRILRVERNKNPKIVDILFTRIGVLFVSKIVVLGRFNLKRWRKAENE